MAVQTRQNAMLSLHSLSWLSDPQNGLDRQATETRCRAPAPLLLEQVYFKRYAWVLPVAPFTRTRMNRSVRSNRRASFLSSFRMPLAAWRTGGHLMIFCRYNTLDNVRCVEHNIQVAFRPVYDIAHTSNAFEKNFLVHYSVALNY
jgi:hypothetical protein